MASYKALIAAALFYGANAHMRLANPPPFAGGNNSPLEANGSNYPCKIVGGNYPSAPSNKIAVGTQQTLSFQGSAVHGGGSCQVSITADENPTKNSKFKVIHSIIGGCPAQAPGNLGDNAQNTNGLGSFKYEIPQGVANGKYTLAWTWFNKIGNREMYMECSPIEVTGGSSDKSFLDKLPDMFIANIPQGGQCEVPAGQDIIFPNPGDSKETIGSGPFATAAPGCAGAGSGSGSGSGGNAAAPTPAPAPAPAPPSDSGSGSGSRGGSGGSGNKGNPGGVFAPGASSAAPTATSLVTVVQPTKAPAAAPTAAPAAPAAPPAAPAGNASGACSGGASSCSKDGAVVCLPDNKWGLCNFGCVVPQLMAAGMACSDGVIMAATNIAPGRARRHVFAHKRALVSGDF